MALPYQCLVARNVSRDGSRHWDLIGACGFRLFVQTQNAVTSFWPAEENHSSGIEQDELQEPSAKRVKLSQPIEDRANFSTLVLSNDQQHLVGVTGEDKCIRVFRIHPQGRLEQLSQRSMTRRPSSIALTWDDSTILCADKFGDVYSLPLLSSAAAEEEEQAEAKEVEESEPQQFLPSASVLTVHSGRNRKTLEEQLKQGSKKQAKSKESLKFKHELLLGHVSMLTDIVYGTVDSRSYLITADRDEHIRVSRGPPQAHIIEGFCHGHEEFVSRLCLTHSGTLVSGGGDAHLFVWDWQNYRLLQKLPLREAALRFLKGDQQFASLLPTNEDDFKIAVSGIWNVPKGIDKLNEILVACEGVPALFRFDLGESSGSGMALHLNGNALDVAFIEPSENVCIAVVAVDHVHEPGSTTEMRSGEGVSRLQHFGTQGDGKWEEAAPIGQGLAWLTVNGLENLPPRTKSGDTGSGSQNSAGNGLGSTDEKACLAQLYHVENLRKRPGAED